MKWGTLVCLVVPTLAVAGRPDYSHLDDEQLRLLLVAIAVGLAGFTGLGLYGWRRYQRSYVPAPGRFSPTQALVSVLVVIAAVLLGAAAKLLP